MTRELLRNLNALLVLIGFVSLEAGIAAHWSGSVAAIVAGVLLMLIGSWPYLVKTLRKKG